jgi:hypothetical protein
MSNPTIQSRLNSIRLTIGLLEKECCELQQELERTATPPAPRKGNPLPQSEIDKILMKRKKMIISKINAKNNA